MINLDPAAEHFDYELAVDIHDLISVEDAMAEMGLGPNGGLVFCMQYLSDNIEWLKDRLDDLARTATSSSTAGPDRAVLSCARHAAPAVPRTLGIPRVRGVPHGRHVSDRCQQVYQRCHSVNVLHAPAQLPHINVITKCDIAPIRRHRGFLTPGSELLGDLNEHTAPQFRALNRALCSLLDDYSMVQFVTLDPTDEDSADHVLMQIENAIQYGEDMEPQMQEEPGEDIPDGF